jgi:hypothetical protein
MLMVTYQTLTLTHLISWPVMMMVPMMSFIVSFLTHVLSFLTHLLSFLTTLLPIILTVRQAAVYQPAILATIQY